MNNPNLYLEPNVICGLGHIMRSRTIGQMWSAMFGGMTYSEHTDPEKLACGVVVFDDYDTGQEWIDYWKELGHTVVVYNDFNVPLEADVYVNQNIGARCVAGGKNLLGPRYFALREDYFGLRINTDGGVFDADAEKRNLDPKEFAQKMALASHVVTAAGITAYEALYLGKQVLLRKVSDSQELTYTNLIGQGYAEPATDKNVERAGLGDQFTLRDGRFLVDGLGAGRVCKAIMDAWRNSNG